MLQILNISTVFPKQTHWDLPSSTQSRRLNLRAPAPSTNSCLAIRQGPQDTMGKRCFSAPLEMSSRRVWLNSAPNNVYSNALAHVPSNPDVAPHLKRIIIIIIFLVLDRGMGEWSKGSNPYPQLNFIKGSKFATPPLTYMLMTIGTWTYLVEGSKSATPSD